MLNSVLFSLVNYKSLSSSSLMDILANDVGHRGTATQWPFLPWLNIWHLEIIKGMDTMRQQAFSINPIIPWEAVSTLKCKYSQDHMHMHRFQQLFYFVFQGLCFSMHKKLWRSAVFKSFLNTKSEAPEQAEFAVWCRERQTMFDSKVLKATEVYIKLWKLTQPYLQISVVSFICPCQMHLTQQI